MSQSEVNYDMMSFLLSLLSFSVPRKLYFDHTTQLNNFKATNEHEGMKNFCPCNQWRSHRIY